MRNPKDAGWPDRGERTSQRDIAERWKWDYLALVQGQHRRRVLSLPRDRTIKAAREKYLEYRQANFERATWSADRTALNHLSGDGRLAVGRMIHSVEPSELQAILDGLAREGYRDSTLRTYRKCWQTFFRWCGPHDPTAELSVRRANLHDVRTFDPAELVELRKAADRVDRQQIGFFPSARLGVELALCMGLRQGEVFALRWEDIRPAEEAVRVGWQIPKDSTVPKGLKGKRARTAYVLEEWWVVHREGSGLVVGRNGQPVGTRTQRNLITRVLDTAGLNATGMGWHILRHQYARHFIERGGRFEELQKSLGHRSITVTEERYGHFHEDVAVKQARERIRLAKRRVAGE